MHNQRLERILADYLGREHCIAVGRGATALWLAMDLLRQPSKNVVVLPSTLCLSPAIVAQLAGLELVFCDVDPATGNMAPDNLTALLASRDDICTVIVAHLYGEPAEIHRLKDICSVHNVTLIEDVAQAFGASVQGKRLGAFGDITVLSFGHTKIIDAGDGGAILTDDGAVAAELRAAAAKLPVKPDQSDAWSGDYRKAYYALAPLAAKQAQLRPLMGRIGSAFPDMYRYAMDENMAQRVTSSLSRLEQELDHRRSMAAIYEGGLSGLPVELLRTTAGGVPWRFNLKADKTVRDDILVRLRNDGFDASSWYPALPPFFTFESSWEKRWPGAAAIEAGILNLWVDGASDTVRVQACSENLQRILGSATNQ